MKQYRLKQWYPSLPKEVKVGTEVTYYEASDTYADHHLGLYCKVEVSPDEVENNPDFWEKTPEKDFQILSFVDELGNYYDWNDDTNCYNRVCSIIVPVSHRETITKVRRLSDGEDFCIGDDVVYLADKPHMNLESDIAKFEIRKSATYPHEDVIIVCNSGCLISSLKNIKQRNRRFITEDGVPIYEGDKYYCVNVDNFHHVWESTCNKRTELNKNYKAFSTVDLANQFYYENKPCLSYKDVENCLRKGKSYQYHSTTLSNVKDTIINKINQ